MSSQFSYELDERQIRILLQDGELDYDSTAWDRFEQTVKPEPRSQFNSFTPKLNLNISRSVIVPALFIILIGGLSAMLFSFVDFKKKEAFIKEVPLNPSVKLAPFKTNSIAKTSVPVKKQPVIKVPEPTKTAEKEPVKALETKAIIKAPPVIKKEEKAVVTVPRKEKIIETKPTETVITLNNEPKKEGAPVVKRKRKKGSSEEIPTINTSSINLNSGNEEPELELK